MDDILLPDEIGEISGGEFVLATVSSVDSSGVKLIFDGQTAASQKKYKLLKTGSQLSANDRVICMKMSGTYVVLGAITADGSGGGSTEIYTTTISDILTAADYKTSYSEAAYYQVGKAASLYVYGRVDYNISSSNDWYTIINIKSGKRPKVKITTHDANNYPIQFLTDGKVQIKGTISIGTNLAFSATYNVA